jgi:hypothetical protein
MHALLPINQEIVTFQPHEAEGGEPCKEIIMQFL